MPGPTPTAHPHTPTSPTSHAIRCAIPLGLALTLTALSHDAHGGVLAPLRQGYNIDFNLTSGPGAGAPASTYPGGAGQAGFWNALNSPFTGTAVLRNLTNTADGASITFAPISGFVGNGFTIGAPGLTGNDALLLADGIDLTNTAGRGVRMTIAPLATGIYDVSVYAIDPGSTAFTQLVWYGSTYGFTTLGGGPIGNPFVMTDGITFRRFPVVVLPTVQARPGASPTELVGAGLAVTAVAHTSGFGSVNGIQIVPRNPTRLYVRPSSEPATFDTNGLSWGSALRNLHHALAIAESTPSVTEIWMQRGTYTPDIQPFATGNRAAAFVVPRGGISIIGGFAGTESTLAERPPRNPATALDPASATILSGEINTAALSDNSQYIMRINTLNAGNPIVLDGLSFIRSDPSGLFESEFGALFIDGSTVSVQSCRFNDNYIAIGAVAGNVTVRDTDLTANRLYAFLHEATSTGALGQFLVERSRFLGNTTPGAFFEPTLRIRATGEFDSCLFVGNSPGSSVIAAATGATTLNNCTIAHNAGIGLIASTVISPDPPLSTVRVNNSILWGNRRTGEPSVEASQITRSPSTVVSLTIFDTIVEGWTGTINANAAAIISRDPRFVDANGLDNTFGTIDDNLRLGPISPARDSGWNSSVVGTLDLDGNPRVVDDPVYANLGFPTGGIPGTVDRGCYEAQTPGQGCSRADVAGPSQAIGADLFLTADDIIVFLGWYFANDSRADFAGANQSPIPDGLLTADDIIVFLGLYFAGC